MTGYGEAPGAHCRVSGRDGVNGGVSDPHAVEIKGRCSQWRCRIDLHHAAAYVTAGQTPGQGCIDDVPPSGDLLGQLKPRAAGRGKVITDRTNRRSTAADQSAALSRQFLMTFHRCCFRKLRRFEIDDDRVTRHFAAQIQRGIDPRRLRFVRRLERSPVGADVRFRDEPHPLRVGRIRPDNLIVS